MITEPMHMKLLKRKALFLPQRLEVLRVCGHVKSLFLACLGVRGDA